MFHYMFVCFGLFKMTTNVGIVLLVMDLKVCLFFALILRTMKVFGVIVVLVLYNYQW